MTEKTDEQRAKEHAGNVLGYSDPDLNFQLTQDAALWGLKEGRRLRWVKCSDRMPEKHVDKSYLVWEINEGRPLSDGEPNLASYWDGSWSDAFLGTTIGPVSHWAEIEGPE